MNEQFVLKMLQAKHLQYEAMKEILPEGVLNRIKSIETELLDIVTEYFTSVVPEKPARKEKPGVRKVSID